MLYKQFGIKKSDYEFGMCESIAKDALISAIKTYRSDKNTTLTTYAARCIKNAVCTYLKRDAFHNGGRKTLKLDDDPKLFMVEDPRRFDEEMAFSDYEQEMISLAHNKILTCCRPEDQVIFNRYLLGETETAIARSLGVSKQIISRKILKLKNLIRVEVLDPQYNLS